MRIIFLFLITVLIACKSQKDSFSLQQQSQLKTDLEILAADDMEGRRVGTEGERKAARFISKRYGELGLTTLEGNEAYFQHFEVAQKANPHAVGASPEDEKIAAINVVGFIDNNAPQTIVIGAHYDHLGHGGFGSLHVGDPEIHNGADDNASGIAGMLMISEKLLTGPKNNNYLFLAFSGEEMGLWGSNYWVKHPNIELQEINYMINLDMIGRLNDEQKLMVNGTGTSPVWPSVLKKAKDYNINIISSESGIAPTDQTSFYVENIPVLGFFTGQHEDYHKPSDDAHKINYPGIKSIMSLVYDIIVELDDDGKLAFIKTKDEKDERIDFKVTLGVMPDYLYEGKGMRIDGVRDGRPAHKADIKKGDVVIQMGDKEITDMMAYMRALGSFEPGSEVQVIIKREGKELIKNVKFDKE